jgi:hypothetical protein
MHSGVKSARRPGGDHAFALCAWLFDIVNPFNTAGVRPCGIARREVLGFVRFLARDGINSGSAPLLCK